MTKLFSTAFTALHSPFLCSFLSFPLPSFPPSHPLQVLWAPMCSLKAPYRPIPWYLHICSPPFSHILLSTLTHGARLGSGVASSKKLSLILPPSNLDYLPIICSHSSQYSLLKHSLKRFFISLLSHQEHEFLERRDPNLLIFNAKHSAIFNKYFLSE